MELKIQLLSCLQSPTSNTSGMVMFADLLTHQVHSHLPWHLGGSRSDALDHIRMKTPALCKHIRGLRTQASHWEERLAGDIADQAHNPEYTRTLLQLSNKKTNNSFFF